MFVVLRAVAKANIRDHYSKAKSSQVLFERAALHRAPAAQRRGGRSAAPDFESDQ
jgi:hypothetical protein